MRLPIAIYICISVFLLRFLYGCGNNATDTNSDIEVPKDTVAIHYVDSIYNLEDTFTVILKNLCENVSDSMVEYTNENSSYIMYDFIDPTAYFIYLSNVDCGITGGTCGDYITIIKRNSEQEYRREKQVCGKLDSVDFRTGEMYYTTVTDKKQYKMMLFDEDYFVEYLSTNYIPEYEIGYISEALDVLDENLVFEKSKSDNPDAIQVNCHRVDVTGEIALIIYSMKNNQIPYSFAFLREKNKTKRDTGVGGAGSITWNQNQNQVIVKYQSGQQIEQYRIDLQKKSFVKI